MNDTPTSRCSTCGYEWTTGYDGSHSCATNLEHKLAAVTAERDAALDALRKIAVTSVTANPNVLHHYRCSLCGMRWSGRPGAEGHTPGCIAAKQLP